MNPNDELESLRDRVVTLERRLDRLREEVDADAIARADGKFACPCCGELLDPRYEGHRIEKAKEFVNRKT